MPYVGMTTFTGLCTACGDRWQEDDLPKICPECNFTGVLVLEEED